MTLTNRQGMFLLALLTVFLMAGMDVASHFATTALDASPPLYASFSLFISAAVLLIIAGPGNLGVATLRDVYTWLYGILQVVYGISEVYMFSLLTATEGNFLQTIITPIALITGFAIFGRRPSKMDYLMNAIILLAIAYMAAHVSGPTKFLALLSVVVSALLYVFRGVVAEIHPTSNKSEGVRDQCRVTGFVLLVTSLLFMGSYALAGYCLGIIMPNHSLMALPSLDAFTHTPALIAAAISGIFIVAPAKYLYFYTSRHINSDNYTIIAAITPLFAFIIELPLAQFHLIDISAFEGQDMVAGLIIIAAAVVMAIYRSKEDKNHAG